MTPCEAFKAGMAARAFGDDAAANPHHDFEPGAAWSLGWHWHDGWRPKGEPRIAPFGDAGLDLMWLASRWTRPQLREWAQR